MFSLQPFDELVFATPTTTQPYQIPEDLILDNPMLDNKNLISFASATGDEKFVSKTGNSGSPRPKRKGQSSKNGTNDRRVMHRDIERKRREQTSKLYVSLRALLPMEHNKGKKSSVSDQMEEAVNYINQKHEKIQELRTRRDNLKKLHSSSSSSCGKNIQSSDGSNNKFQESVSMNRVVDKLEILITTKSPEFELSQVLAQLSERELDVVSCVSTRTKAGFLHKVDVEGNDMRSLDIWELQNKLSEAIKQQHVIASE